MLNKLTDDEIIKDFEKGNKPSGKVQFSKFQPLKANKIPLTEDLSEDGRGLSAEDLFKEISRLKAENGKLKAYIQNNGSGWGLISHLEFCKNLKAEAYKEFADKIYATTWYHINKNGELVMGANSETDIPLFKAEDVFNLLKELVGDEDEN